MTISKNDKCKPTTEVHSILCRYDRDCFAAAWCSLIPLEKVYACHFNFLCVCIWHDRSLKLTLNLCAQNINFALKKSKSLYISKTAETIKTSTNINSSTSFCPGSVVTCGILQMATAFLSLLLLLLLRHLNLLQHIAAGIVCKTSQRAISNNVHVHKCMYVQTHAYIYLYVCLW